jgi:hypothetical protein
MATIRTEGAYPSDWLKREEDSLYSREQVTIVSGSNASGSPLVSGTILGKITATGKYKPQTLAAVDGSQTAAAILLGSDTYGFTVDANAADKKAVVISRDAIVMQYGLVYGSDVTTAGNRATVNGQLATLGILVREGA